jgi:ketosteroid isomerase-like protein
MSKNRDVDGMVAVLHPEIEVTFPETERNWNGIQTARQKFLAMFDKYPDFHATYEITSEDDHSATLACHFWDPKTDYDVHRTMKYIFEGGKILAIHHL